MKNPRGRWGDNFALVRGMCTDSYHHMGGTLMAASAAEGVVDADLRLHGVKNGYVCSGSVFPSSGYSNPTHTVLALGMRLADRLAGVSRSVAVTEISGGVREIALPGSGGKTSQLGFGTAYLLGPGLDAAKSRRLLDAAWDAGVRHFDTARLYGYGRTEELVGEFLARHPEATVTTKFGMVPATTAERVMEAAQRLAPGLRKLGWKRKDKAVFRAAEARAALEVSLRKLRRERVELYLLHEVTTEELVHGDLLEFLLRQKEAGVIGEFGAGGEFWKMPGLLAERKDYVPVVQFERSVLGPEMDLHGSYGVFYRTFAPAAKALRKLFDREPELLTSWSEQVGAELAEPAVLGRLLLKASLEAWPGALQLFSTGSEEHIFGNVEVAGDSSLAGPAGRLAELLAEDDHGLGRELYGGPVG